MNNRSKHQAEKIALLNDACRQSVMIPIFGQRPGIIRYTPGIENLTPKAIIEIAAMVRDYSDFNNNNDPYGERDFGSFTYDKEKIFWKIDYYDLDLMYGSPDPSDPEVTTRVLTIMLANEY